MALPTVFRQDFGPVIFFCFLRSPQCLCIELLHRGITCLR